VADIRDPMVEYDPYSGIAYPTDPRVRAVRLRVERTIAERASRAVFVTRGARRICEERYGAEAARRFVVIPNGYDESEFTEAEQGLVPYVPSPDSFRLVHSGTVYPGDERSPAPLFEALKRLRATASLPPGFKLVLRATGYDAMVAQLVDSLGVRDLVEVAPSLSYRAALREMLTADALLLIQGSASNPAIPAKLYEYLRAGRPMLGLVHPEGDSHEILSRLGAATLARHDDADSIEHALRRFFDDWRSGAPRVVPRNVAGQFSRAAQTGDFAALLDAVVEERSRGAAVAVAH
jgi:glycosyltransferase involved in cell wall biosynthesis